MGSAQWVVYDLCVLYDLYQRARRYLQNRSICGWTSSTTAFRAASGAWLFVMTDSSASFNLSQYNAPTGSGGRDFETGSKLRKNSYSGAYRSLRCCRLFKVGSDAASFTRNV